MFAHDLVVVVQTNLVLDVPLRTQNDLYARECAFWDSMKESGLWAPGDEARRR